MKNNVIMASIVFLFFLLSGLVSVVVAGEQGGGAVFPAIFVFGDSTVDPGNNDYIMTLFRGDHPPYGRNFPGRAATGRCSDGKLIPDILASMFRIKEFIPPFLDPNLSDEEIVTGVSFASAGSGYDEMTTAISLAIEISKQVEYFRGYISRLEGIVGKGEAAGILRDSLVIISSGTNDFVLNFYDIPTRRAHFDIDKYQDFLLNKLKNILQELYDLGCRKIVVAGLPPLGCMPIQLTVMSPVLRECVETQNSDAVGYNSKLQRLLTQTQNQLQGSTILYVDIFTIPIDMIKSPHKYGLVETKKGCCGTGVLESGPLCMELSPVCSNPEQYMFFDSIHPTESVYNLVAQRLVKRLLPRLLLR